MPKVYHNRQINVRNQSVDEFIQSFTEHLQHLMISLQKYKHHITKTCEATCWVTRRYLRGNLLESRFAKVQTVPGTQQCHGPNSAMDPTVPGTQQCQGPDSARDPTVPGTLQCQGSDSARDPTVALLLSCVSVHSKSESILDKYTNLTRNHES